MQNLMPKIISLAKRRGFIFPSSEIYGGFGSCYDFGPLGVEMKNNIKKAWWDEMTKNQENIVGLDAAILMSPKVWQASGHLTAGFADELVECKSCHKRFKVDEIEGQTRDRLGTVPGQSLKCPELFNTLNMKISPLTNCRRCFDIVFILQGSAPYKIFTRNKQENENPEGEQVPYGAGETTRKIKEMEKRGKK